MPYFTKYHMADQHAYALLGPVAATLRELEQRAHHFAERLTMSDADRETLLAAEHTLATARAEIERLQDAAAAPAGAPAGGR